VTRTGAAIEARELTKTYGGGVRALDGLGFTVEAGTVFGLLGPNGAGKSTTVKILTTLSRPTAARRAWPAGTCLPNPSGCGGPSAWSPSAPGSTWRPPGGRT
jgi:ABC-type glutathione transport system ATPase component